MPNPIAPSEGEVIASPLPVTSLTSRRATGGQRIAASATMLAASTPKSATRLPGWRASRDVIPVRPTSSAPVPIETTCSRIAEAVAAQAGTPFRRASIAIPAIAQTFPGRYFPMLESTQTRAASGHGSLGPQPASILRHDSISSPEVARTRRRLGATSRGEIRHSIGCSRTWAQLLTTYRTTNATTRTPPAHWSPRHHRLCTEGLAVPPLEPLRDPRRGQLLTPPLPCPARLGPPLLRASLLDRIGDRAGGRLGQHTASVRGEGGNHAPAVGAGDHRHAGHEPFERREPEALTPRREHHHVGQRELPRDLDG